MEKNRKSFFVMTIIVISIVIALVWRFRTLDFSNIAISDDEIPSSYYLTSNYLAYDGDSSYQIDGREREATVWNDILEILNTSSYRQDFRNLWPLGVHSIDTDKNYDGNSAIIKAIIGENQDEYVIVHFISSSLVAISDEERAGYRIYHPTNSETMYKLIEYIQKNCVKQ